MGWFDGATPATDDQIASAATAGVMKVDPKTGGAVRAKSWPETIADTASLALYAYGGPEAPAGASLATRGLYAALRSLITGGETVGADVVSAGGRKVAGKPADLSVSGEASRFAQGTGMGAAFEAARPLVRRMTGESKATAAGTEAVKTAREEVTGATRGVTEAGLRGTQEELGRRQVRSELGATAPAVAPGIINQGTRESQNALSHSINGIHSDINQGYKDLFAPYAKNPVNAETVTGPLHDLKQGLEDTGRMAQVSPKARVLLTDSLELGTKDPLKQYLPGQDLSGLTKIQRKNLTSSFSKFSNKKLEPVPATVDQILAVQNRANDVLRSTTENATSKSVAASVMKATTAALDELGETKFLTPAEKETLTALKGRTRSFYTDFGPLMRRLWKTQTPGSVGKELFEKQEPHVIEQAIKSATERGELPGLQRAFADYVAPEGATLLGDKGIVPKLANMDATGQLAKLYPGRYGWIGTWLDTATQQKRLEGLAKSPVLAEQMNDGLRAALDSPEGKTFRDAATAALKPGSGKSDIIPFFLKRWIGVYQPIEAAAMGMGMMKGNLPLAATAFGAFVGNTLFHRALSNDAFREAYYKAIMNPNVRQATYSLARLAMGMATQELKDQQQAPVGGP